MALTRLLAPRLRSVGLSHDRFRLAQVFPSLLHSVVIHCKLCQLHPRVLTPFHLIPQTITVDFGPLIADILPLPRNPSSRIHRPIRTRGTTQQPRLWFQELVEAGALQPARGRYGRRALSMIACLLAVQVTRLDFRTPCVDVVVARLSVPRTSARQREISGLDA